MDISKLTKKLSNFLLVNIIILGISILVVALVFIFLVQPSSGWATLGAFLVLFSVIKWSAITLCVVALINLIRGIIIKREIKNYLKQNIPVEPQSLRKFRNRYLALVIVSILLTVPAILLLVDRVMYIYNSIPTKADIQADNARQEKYREDARKGEPERIDRILSGFKIEVDDTQTAFVGFGVVPNTGSCLNLAPGSLFNPGSTFKPKLIKDPEWRNHSVVNSLNEAGYGSVSIKMDSGGPIFNNMNDARCFSDEDHYAYQVPNYLEDPYPTFYCVDDTHVGVQKGNKQIKGSNCDDFDPNYVPPATRPSPDMRGY